MTPLERLGLEVVAYTLIGSRPQAATLCALLDAGGRAVGWEALSRVRPWHWRGEPATTDGAMRARICLLRSALEDLGFAGVIVTGDRAGGLSYALPDPGRTAIINRLIEEVTGC